VVASDKIKLVIKYDDESRQTAEVYVEGKIQDEACRFLLDTGCAKTTLTWNHLTQNFLSIGKQESSGTFGKAEFDLVKLKSISAGPLSRTDWAVRRAPEGGTDRHLLGMDVMMDHCLSFAFDDALVNIVSEADARRSLADQDLIMDRGLIPCIAVRAGGVDSSAIWDSGAGITLVDTNFVTEHPELFVSLGSEMGTDSTNRKQETPIYMMSGLAVAGHEFNPVKVAAVPLTNPSNPTKSAMNFVLGFSALRQAHWLFDFPNRKWSFEMLR